MKSQIFNKPKSKKSLESRLKDLLKKVKTKKRTTKKRTTKKRTTKKRKERKK